MNEIVDRVSFEMQRYQIEAMTDGTFSIVDGYQGTAVRSGLSGMDEPQDICDDMNARAAIGAMREPTEAMKDAPDGNTGISEEVWQAMIDAALKEP